MENCVICGTKFKSKSLYNRHINNKKGCISTKEIIKIYNKLKLAQECINDLHLKLNTQQKNNKKIEILPFTQEKKDHIRIKNIFNKTSEEIFYNIVEQLWCNKEYTSNFNIYLSNIHSQFIKIIDCDHSVIILPRNIVYNKAFVIILQILENKINFFKNNSDSKDFDLKLKYLNYIYSNIKFNAKNFKNIFFSVLINHSNLILSINTNFQ
jgi:uncharacterized C2H2 Zn-finger protein